MSAIQNMYELMPKKYSNSVFNPSFDLHGLSLPLRGLVAAPSGMGKTNLVMNILRVFSQGRQGTFNTIHIITRNADEPLYNWVRDVAPDIVIREGVEHSPKLDDFDPKENHLIIWDDLVLEGKVGLKNVQEMYLRGRKLNVSTIFISQSYYDTPKMIRINCSWISLLKLGNTNEVAMIMRNHGLGVTKQKLLAIYQHATAEKLQPLLIDLTASVEAGKFRKGFATIDINAI
jgi:hypothetical protein